MKAPVERGARRTSLFSWFTQPGVDEAEIRAEIWRLGSRHRGEPLDGAVKELGAPGLPQTRARLLRACVRRLRSQ